jgi:hypothetical protein
VTAVEGEWRLRFSEEAANRSLKLRFLAASRRYWISGMVHVRIRLAGAPGPGPEGPAGNDPTSLQRGAGQHGLYGTINQGIHAADVSTWKQSPRLGLPCDWLSQACDTLTEFAEAFVVW